ncbi:hypothetical protein LZ31DRAFT_600567 [Colletotrichum somersetense]|nr:hypothetical protein LZ31DRAFT_600567 [Colletotrichum somersetense]
MQHVVGDGADSIKQALQQGLCPVPDPRLELPESDGGFGRLLNSSVPSRKAGGNAEAISFPLPLVCEEIAEPASIMALCKQDSIIGSAACSLAMKPAIPYMIKPGQVSLKLKSGFIFGGLAMIGTFGGLFHVTELKYRAFGEI